MIGDVAKIFSADKRLSIPVKCLYIIEYIPHGKVSSAFNRPELPQVISIGEIMDTRFMERPHFPSYFKSYIGQTSSNAIIEDRDMWIREWEKYL